MSDERVAVVGAGDDGTGEADDLLAAVSDGGGDPVVADPAALGQAAVVVAAGEAALVDLARAGVEVPVVPVDAGPGTRSVPAADVADAVARALAGEAATVSVSGLRVGEDDVALFDVALMAAEPARISAFSVRYGDETVAAFRADGVVASTPAGSMGYNRAADGPLVAPGTGVVAVVPVAPFQTNDDRWVLPPDAVAISVERDETPVELLLDGRIERAVPTGDPLTLSATAGLELVVVPESRSFF